jgi:hypothetical protein
MAGVSTLTIRLASTHPITVRAVLSLREAWREATGGAVRVATGAGIPAGPHLFLGLGSLVRPSLLVRFALPYPDEAARKPAALALTSAAWDALDDSEPWRALAAPLGARPRVGRIDPTRRWAVALGRSGVRPDDVDDEEQLHLVGGLRPPTGSSVWWPNEPGTVAAVLGRADRVFGARLSDQPISGMGDPLVFDAVRAQIPVAGATVADTPASIAPRLSDALAGLVPPSLLDEPSVWSQVAHTARDAHDHEQAPEPLFTPARVQQGRDRITAHRAQPPKGWQKLRRRHDKLRRDPKKFLADSSYAPLRALGKIAFRDDE